MTKFLGIASGKGGTGKTTLAINIGSALTNIGRDVVVLDANLSTPHVSLHLGDTKLPVTIHHVLRGTNHILDAGYMHPSGLRVIPGDVSLGAINTSYEGFNNVLLDLTGRCEAVIIDTPPGLGRDARELLSLFDELLIVTTPDLPSVSDALKTVRLAETNNIKILGVIVNKVTGSEYELTEDNVSSLIGHPVIATVPFDEHVVRSLHEGHPVLYHNPDAPSSAAFMRIAARLVGQNHDLSGSPIFEKPKTTITRIKELFTRK